MAIQVTEQEVLDVMETTLTSNKITPFLRMGRNFVDNRFVSGLGYTDEDRRQGTILAAAHYATTMKDPEITAEGHGATNATYGKQTGGEGLKGSSFGQALLGMAKDPSDLEGSTTVSFRVLGNDPSGTLDDVPNVP